jgi:hypothetical protein
VVLHRTLLDHLPKLLELEEHSLCTNRSHCIHVISCKQYITHMSYLEYPFQMHTHKLRQDHHHHNYHQLNSL